MASPVLNEHLICDALDPDTAISFEGLRSLLAHVVLDACDRKVERLKLLDIIERALEAEHTSSLLEAAAHMREVYKFYDYPAHTLGEGIKVAGKKLTAQRVGLYDLMTKIMQCPEDTDKIN